MAEVVVRAFRSPRMETVAEPCILAGLVQPEDQDCGGGVVLECLTALGGGSRLSDNGFASTLGANR